MNASKAVQLGTLYCVLSALAYTAYNACLCDVSDKYDSAWVNCVQATVSVAIFGTYLLAKSIRNTVRGWRAFPPGREVLALLVIGLVTQAGGVLFVWAMSAVGVAVSATLQLGVTLAASALFGLIVLKERIFWQHVLAIVLITASAAFFSLGAGSTGEAAGQGSSMSILLGISAAILAGVAFAVLTVGVRKTVTGATSPEAIVFLINLMGVVALGPWCMYQLGPERLLATAPRDLGVMLAAGAMNLTAFFLVAKSLQMIPVVRFNVLLNGLSSSLSVLIGIAWFGEAYNLLLLVGILLSIAGILVISRVTTTA